MQYDSQNRTKVIEKQRRVEEGMDEWTNGQTDGIRD